MFKKDKEIVLTAVKADWEALRYVDSALRDDKEVVLSAVKNNGWAIQFASEKLKKDKEIVLEAFKTVENKERFYNYIDESLKNDPDVLNLLADNKK